MQHPFFDPISERWITPRPPPEPEPPEAPSLAQLSEHWAALAEAKAARERADKIWDLLVTSARSAGVGGATPENELAESSEGGA
jgi:hypothetical protein